MLGRLDPDALDFLYGGRSSTLVRCPMGSHAPSALTSADVDRGLVEGLLHFRRQRRVSMLYVVLSEGGALQLDPAEGPQRHLGWAPAQLPLQVRTRLGLGLATRHAARSGSRSRARHGTRHATHGSVV